MIRLSLGRRHKGDAEIWFHTYSLIGRLRAAASQPSGDEYEWDSAEGVEMRLMDWNDAEGEEDREKALNELILTCADAADHLISEAIAGEQLLAEGLAEAAQEIENWLAGQ